MCVVFVLSLLCDCCVIGLFACVLVYVIVMRMCGVCDVAVLCFAVFAFV